ncbi:hypothetical protein AVEN_225393-1 [Araneus ventricosus]|uniref:Uncharacterized protein n=1 Tax=Araneus ventricosus TaxID=182803 RepID=A0A4Y2HXE4_ARAVE|nr:hypothetical protein AVEN_225393-1 [Araneus ventricosus]
MVGKRVLQRPVLKRSRYGRLVIFFAELKYLTVSHNADSIRKRNERLRKLLAKVETDEDPDFDNEDNRREDVLEEKFSDHESFCEHDTESEEDGDSENKDVNNLELFWEGIEWRKTKFRKKYSLS